MRTTNSVGFPMGFGPRNLPVKIRYAQLGRPHLCGMKALQNVLALGG